MPDALTVIRARYRLPDFTSAVAIPYHPSRWPYEITRRGFRSDLARLFRDLGYTRGAEIGVWQGEFSACLLAHNPALHLTLVDPWVAYSDYRDHTRPDLIATAYQQTLDRLAEPITAGRVTVLRKFSTEAAADVPDRSLDFVYLDGNHSLWHVINDLTLWSKKVKPGGIIAGHDYIRLENRIALSFHVVEAVDAFTRANEIQPWFVLGQRVYERRKRDRERSYFWVQP